MIGNLFASVNIMAMFNECIRKQENGDDSTLGDIHGFTALYKAFVTEKTMPAIETIRRSCGGHGYLMNSGLPSIYANWIAAATYDGDNYILLL